MVQYEQLPIYRKSFELAVYIEKVVHGFSRNHKYGLGKRLQHIATNVLEKVLRAQNTQGAQPEKELSELRIEGELMKTLLHLVLEPKALSFQKESLTGMARLSSLQAKYIVW
ncbi:MAG: four helix bundle protein [Deltaproteobacteria bacterium]|nr:four helix bundle protein [Deltaproteobacteria bacterium]